MREAGVERGVVAERALLLRRLREDRQRFRVVGVHLEFHGVGELLHRRGSSVSLRRREPELREVGRQPRMIRRHERHERVRRGWLLRLRRPCARATKGQCDSYQEKRGSFHGVRLVTRDV